MKTHSRNGWSSWTHKRQRSFLRLKLTSKEKTERIDLGLAILAAIRPGERLSCAEIAAYCDCCPERINQIEYKALARLRTFLMMLGPRPARLSAEQVAWIINCRRQDVPILVAARLLKPLENPPPNGITDFDATELLELTKDPTWRRQVINVVNHRRHNLDTHRRNYPAIAGPG